MRLLVALLFVLWSFGAAHAQGYQCRTSPVGASTAYCASEAFVTNSITNPVVSSLTSSGAITSTVNNTGTSPLGSFIASSPNASYFWNVTGNPTDQKNWDAFAAGNVLLFRAVNDANTAANPWMTVTRGAGATVSGVLFPTSLTITPTASSLNQAISTSQTGSGTNTGSSVNLNLMNITSDNINAGGNFVDGLLVQQVAGGAAAQGGRQAVFAALFLNATTSASNTNRNYVAGAFQAQASVNDNGTGGSPAGAVFGFNAVGNLTTGATFYSNVAAIETNVAVATGASVAYKAGIQIADGTTDAVQGTTFDCELCLSNQTTTGWKDGILFGAMNSQHPVAAAGSLIATTGSFTVTNGIDFSSYTFSGSAFKSTAFSVSGAGAVSGLSYTANGSVGVNCSGSPTGSFASVGGIVTHC